MAPNVESFTDLARIATAHERLIRCLSGRPGRASHARMLERTLKDGELSRAAELEQVIHTAAANDTSRGGNP